MNYLANVFTTLRNNTPVLHATTLIILGLTGVSLLGLTFDDRTLMGVNVWIKPLKFTISTAIYMATVGFLIQFYPYSVRKRRIFAGIVAWTLLIEMIIIPLQAARGVQSHYNIYTPLDGMLFGCMGILIGINVLLMALFAFDSIRLKLKTKPAVQWAIAIGWLIVIFGSWVGGQMIGQMAHNVGVADGGAGLPVLNWSTKGGDLRIAHFFGLHGIQVIPLFAFFLSKRTQWNTKTQIGAVLLFSLAYAGWVAFVFYQAKQAIPLIALS